jgi:hypothetical protein
MRLLICRESAADSRRLRRKPSTLAFSEQQISSAGQQAHNASPGAPARAAALPRARRACESAGEIRTKRLRFLNSGSKNSEINSAEDRGAISGIGSGPGGEASILI